MYVRTSHYQIIPEDGQVLEGSVKSANGSSIKSSPAKEKLTDY